MRNSNRQQKRGLIVLGAPRRERESPQQDSVHLRMRQQSGDWTLALYSLKHLGHPLPAVLGITDQAPVIKIYPPVHFLKRYLSQKDLSMLG